MRIRHLVKRPKVSGEDTGWRTGDLPPRHCPVYSKTKPMADGWKWRSLRAETPEGQFSVVALCRSGRGKQQALLLKDIGQPAWSLIARFEQHSSHPGLHVHSNCERSGIEAGGEGFSGLARIPPIGSRHRRTVSLTDEMFWNKALKFFGVEAKKGPLL